MSMHRLMALSMVCGSMSCSVVASVRWGAAAAPPSGTPSAAPLPASLFLPSARDARPALIANGLCDGGRPAAATEHRRVDVIGAKDVRSWFVGIAATHRTSAGRALAAMASSRPRVASCTSIEPSRRPTAACGGVGGRSRQRGAVERLRHAGATPALEGPAAADTEVHAAGPTRHPSLSGTPRLRTPCRAVATAGTPARGRIRAYSPAHPCVRTVEPLTSLVFQGFPHHQNR